jgi:hypothetical protein
MAQPQGRMSSGLFVDYAAPFAGRFEAIERNRFFIRREHSSCQETLFCI